MLTVQLLLNATTQCYAAYHNRLLVVGDPFYDLATLSNDCQQLWGFFEKKCVGENQLLHVSYIELVHAIVPYITFKTKSHDVADSLDLLQFGTTQGDILGIQKMCQCLSSSSSQLVNQPQLVGFFKVF